MTLAGQGAFAGSGAIGRYWQARCLGFDVRRPNGRPLGVVVAVECDHESGRPTMLLVERRGHRPALRVEPGSVTLIDPWRRLLVVALPRTDPWTGHARAAGRSALRGGNVARERAVRAGVASWGLLAPASRAVPVAHRFGFWLGARTIYALAFACWLYGAAVFLVTRPTVRLLLAATRLVLRIVLWLTLLVVAASEGTRRAAGRAVATVAELERRPNHPPRRRRSRHLSPALRWTRRFTGRNERVLLWAVVVAALVSLSWGIADAAAPAIAIGILLLLAALRIRARVRFARHSAGHS